VRNPENVMTGRPTLYKEEYAEQARKLCLLGSTDVELADFFEVAESTLNLWKLEHPTFSESIKKGKAQADADVADRLYQRAMGYEHPDVHLSNFQGVVSVTPITKVYAPDPTAAIFWLKNRQRSKWRDKVDTEHSGSVEVTSVNVRLVSANGD
jgi:hypothetical protein